MSAKNDDRHYLVGNALLISKPAECIRCFGAGPICEWEPEGWQCTCGRCGHQWLEAFPQGTGARLGGLRGAR